MLKPKIRQTLRRPTRTLRKFGIKSRKYLREISVEAYLLGAKLASETRIAFGANNFGKRGKVVARFKTGKGLSIDLWQRGPTLRIVDPKQRNYFTITTDAITGRVKLTRRELGREQFMYFPYTRMDEKSFLTAFRNATKEAIKIYKPQQ
ncbi:MAG: hypothetical protein HY392_01850 [Candidatus Diapherotrites archaeon]|nr:hypothetical protein [Candidatus Diapherotrites archaeon]